MGRRMVCAEKTYLDGHYCVCWLVFHPVDASVGSSPNLGLL